LASGRRVTQVAADLEISEQRLPLAPPTPDRHRAARWCEQHRPCRADGGAAADRRACPYPPVGPGHTRWTEHGQSVDDHSDHQSMASMPEQTSLTGVVRDHVDRTPTGGCGASSQPPRNPRRLRPARVDNGGSERGEHIGDSFVRSRPAGQNERPTKLRAGCELLAFTLLAGVVPWSRSRRSKLRGLFLTRRLGGVRDRSCTSEGAEQCLPPLPGS
jgi:hypothetical protein